MQILKTLFDEYEVRSFNVDTNGESIGSDPIEFFSVGQAMDLLKETQSYLPEECDVVTMRKILDESRSITLYDYEMSDEEVLEMLAKQLKEGTIKLHPRETYNEQLVAVKEKKRPAIPNFGPLPVFFTNKGTNWIGMQLSYEDESPVANEAYVIELPDGKIITGSTNSYGKVNLNGIKKGKCKLTLSKVSKDILIKKTKKDTGGKNNE